MATLRIAVATALACGMLASASIPPSRAGQTSEVTFGSQWWTQSAVDAKYQEFRVVPHGGFLESFVLRQWSGRNLLSVQGVNGLVGDQNTRMTWANGVKFRLDLGYQETPHTFSNIARWGWLQAAPGVFVLPDSLQARNQGLPASYTTRMLDYLKTAPGVDLGFQTGISSARARYRVSKDWQLEARGSVRQRDGLKPYAMSFGFSTALENPEPIDQRMVDVDLVADYRRAAFTLQASGGLSSFENDISTLRVDNPKRITSISGGDGTAVGALDLYPDNQVVRGTIALGYLLPRRSAFSATLGVASGTQNDDFLAFTTNSALPQSSLDSLPARSLDAKTTQVNADMRLRTQASDKLAGSLYFNYVDYSNSTEELNFIGQAPYEASWQRFIEHHNHIFNATRWHTGADFDFDLSSAASVGALAEYRVRERSPREVEKDVETVLGARTRVRAPGDLTFQASYTRGDRQLDAFLAEDYFGLRTRSAVGSTPGLYDSLGRLEQAGLRRFDVADRVQDVANAGLTLPLGDRIELAANYGYTNNDYKSDTGTDTTLGLQSEVVHMVATNAVVHVNDQLDLTGGLGYGLTTADQRSRASGAAFSFSPDSGWSAKLEDEETFLNTGFAWSPSKSPLSLSGEYEVSRTYSTYDLDNGLHNAADLPDVMYRRQDVWLELGWRWLARTSISGRYNWEQFDMVDWAVNDVPLVFPVTGTANAVFLGDSSRSYKAHRIALVLRHKF